MKMTLLGAGVRTPFVLRGLADAADRLGLTQVVLHDVDGERLTTMHALGSYLSREWRAPFEVRAEPDSRAALAGAAFVFSAVRVGQDRARAIDEAIPLRYGVLGQETTGPAGFAMAMRTIPVVLEIARTIEEVAPGALVVNFTNPVGLIMQALTEHTSLRAIGVCDGPVEMKRGIAALLDVPPHRVDAGYFGLNHCGWMHRVVVDGRDRLPEVLDRYDELSQAEVSWRLFDAELVRTIGMLPMEYLYFYYYRERAVENIVRSGGTRGAQVAEINAGLWPALRARIAADDLDGARLAWQRAVEARGSTYLARERGDRAAFERAVDAPARGGSMFEGDGYEGVAVAVLTAAAEPASIPLIVNTRNNGAIPDLGDDDVVEVTCLVDGRGVHPVPQGPMPPAARALVVPVKEFERLTVEACLDGSYGTALQALLVHPLVPSFPVAKSILDDYIDEHPDLLRYGRSA